MATSKAHIRATAKYEKNNYFKTLVRFKKEDEERIRNAAGDSLNGFIVKCVLDNLNGEESTKVADTTPDTEAAEITPRRAGNVRIVQSPTRCENTRQHARKRLETADY